MNLAHAVTSTLTPECQMMIVGIRDTQELLSGKWKTEIIGALYYGGKMRFMDLKRHLSGIAPKVLSKELKDLEMNHLISRTVLDTMPITVEYELTEQGKSLKIVIEAMAKWGINYRKQLFEK
ncbi:helix-turn-helix domain-containing protein [Chitinophaga sancti]|uniref:winged helix-turn-helix transcriptional regulator n=1 Tax=Chitinophaga sancti TaxID=1004 RepID=UPI002A7520A2|nr:helix-turn-helix domain-containing protein [Chitinophaga sancti]WPQ60549.1 helix-turn-helix domain-containing protein [Chitinophaga sancti]